MNIDKKDVLRLLSHAGGEIPEDLDGMVDQAIQTVEDFGAGGETYQVFDRDDPVLRKILIGNDIADLLKDSFKVILMATTLGPRVETEIRRLGFVDLTYSVIMDGAASAGAEALAENLNRRLEDEFMPYYLTDRFSPGYGDLDIKTNVKLLELLNTKRMMGLTVNEEGIMTPRKSVSAIIGVSENPQPTRNGCKKCDLRNCCRYKERR